MSCSFEGPAYSYGFYAVSQAQSYYAAQVGAGCDVQEEGWVPMAGKGVGCNGRT